MFDPAEPVETAGWELAAIGPMDPSRMRRGWRAFGLVPRYFRARLLHADRIPATGGVLVVGNHATWGVDSFALFPELYRATGRFPRGLGEKVLFATETSRRVFAAVGAVPGTQGVGERLLQSGELCVCYPGGERDSFKPWWRRHQLLWEGRTGYLRLALRVNAPIVPVMGVGADDAFPVLFRERVLGRRLFGRPRYDLPVFLTLCGPSALPTLPFPVRMTFEVGEPLRFDAEAEQVRQSLARGEDIGPLVDRLHARVWAACQAQLDELARRHPAPLRERLARAVARVL